MKLYESMMEDAILMDRATEADGMGGFIVRWTEGAPIKAVFGKNSSMQARIAEKEGVKEVYTLTTYSNVRLSFHDVVKRVKTGQTYRVTSNVEDNETPAVATFSMAQVAAEVWNLP